MVKNKMSLANKYRPQGFDALVGQDSIKTILLNQIQTGNLKHAYLFCGGAGTGKTTSSRIIAKLMNEGQGRTIELDCASNNGVDDMRMIIEECKTKPVNSKYKIFVLDECHMLTVQAWNSLLKILEEPPAYVIFLFCTTDPQKIIPTVLSRVQRFNFQRISVEDIFNRLKYIIEQENRERNSNLFGETTMPSIQYEDKALEYIARLAKGGMRDSITTLEKCLDYSINLTLDNVLKVTSGGVTEEMMIELTNYLINKDIKSALLLFNQIYMNGIDVSLFIKLYTEFLQNSVKYIFTGVADITTLSDVVIQWLYNLGNCGDYMGSLLQSLIDMRTGYNAGDLKILLESWLVRVCR